MSSTVRIVNTPDILHGKPHIEGTRVGVYELAGYITLNDVSVEHAAEEFGLDEAQVQAAVEYYDTHPELMNMIRAQKEAHQNAIARRSRAP